MSHILQELSDEKIRNDCPHCNPHHQAFQFPLEETEEFYIICDASCIREGHILIIPKMHISCIGAYPKELFEKVLPLYEKTIKFIKDTYGSIATFEHGTIGQSVYHSHIHLLPFEGRVLNIIPEGENYYKTIGNLYALTNEFEKEKQYLFVSIEKNMWTVDTTLGAPRFFRDRFAAAEGRPERGNWKLMYNDEKMRKDVEEENRRCQKKWEKYFEKK